MDGDKIFTCDVGECQAEITLTQPFAKSARQQGWFELSPAGPFQRFGCPDHTEAELIQEGAKSIPARDDEEILLRRQLRKLRSALQGATSTNVEVQQGLARVETLLNGAPNDEWRRGARRETADQTLSKKVTARMTQQSCRDAFWLNEYEYLGGASSAYSDHYTCGCGQQHDLT